VLREWSGQALLDSYERERRPVAEHNVERSADAAGTTREAGDELPVDLGGRIPHVWTAGREGRVSTLDLLGPGLTLFTGPRSQPWDVAAAGLGGSLPLEVQSLDAVTARALGIRGDGALLARPDGVPAGWWPSAAKAAPALRAAVESLAGGATRAVHAAVACEMGEVA
jgi:hypothetical protein